MSLRKTQMFKDYSITVTDSELLAYIYALEEKQRDRMLLAALRIGFLTLSEAKSDIDRKTISDMTEQLCTVMAQQQAMIELSFRNLSGLK